MKLSLKKENYKYSFNILEGIPKLKNEFYKNNKSKYITLNYQAPNLNNWILKKQIENYSCLKWFAKHKEYGILIANFKTGDYNLYFNDEKTLMFFLQNYLKYIKIVDFK